MFFPFTCGAGLRRTHHRIQRQQVDNRLPAYITLLLIRQAGSRLTASIPPLQRNEREMRDIHAFGHLVNLCSTFASESVQVQLPAEKSAQPHNIVVPAFICPQLVVFRRLRYELLSLHNRQHHSQYLLSSSLKSYQSLSSTTRAPHCS